MLLGLGIKRIPLNHFYAYPSYLFRNCSSTGFLSASMDDSIQNEVALNELLERLITVRREGTVKTVELYKKYLDEKRQHLVLSIQR